jgi:hypothetical protein
MSSSAPPLFWWPVYLLQYMEYLLWTWFNKYMLTMLTHHSLQLVSGLVTGAALASFLSWLSNVSDETVISLVYSGTSAYALGHSLCGILFYIHVLQRPSRAVYRPPASLHVLSPAGYTGTFLGLYIFSFWLTFPLDPVRSSFWSAVVFPCLGMGFIAQFSSAYEVQPFKQPYNDTRSDSMNTTLSSSTADAEADADAEENLHVLQQQRSRTKKGHSDDDLAEAHRLRAVAARYSESEEDARRGNPDSASTDQDRV